MKEPDSIKERTWWYQWKNLIVSRKEPDNINDCIPGAIGSEWWKWMAHGNCLSKESKLCIAGACIRRVCPSSMPDSMPGLQSLTRGLNDESLYTRPYDPHSPRDPAVPHAPNRPSLSLLSVDQIRLSLSNALRYHPVKFHAMLAKEFKVELDLYGHVYMYRFMPSEYV